MENKNIYIEPISASDFEKHIENSSNIFFSGSYGMGKTTYLKKMFNVEAGILKDKYISIHLFPVNYSIASNKDIFELIKYDVLYNLLDYLDIEDLDLLSEDFYKNDLGKYISENIGKILLSFITLIPKIGESIEKIQDKILKINQDYEKIKKDNTKSKILEFIESINSTKGNIYENDFYTDLIVKLVKVLKNKSNKKILLVIDDLDRIDPSHIFRILNVLSAHIDSDLYNEKSNKFEIDKVVLVADYFNLKNIFHHIYGEKTDFKGYIDKFYSNEVFEYSFGEKLNSILHGYIFRKEASHQLFAIKFILVVLFENRKFNLRQLAKLDVLLDDLGNFHDENIMKCIVKLYDNDVIKLISNLNDCINSLNSFLTIFENQKEEKIRQLVQVSFTSNLSILVSKDEKNFELHLKNKIIQFKTFNSGRYALVELDTNMITNINVFNYWELLIKYIEEFKNHD